VKKKRDYRKEYDDYHSKHLKDNNARHRVRYDAEKAGRVKVGDGKDIDHRDNNPRNNSSSNVRVIPRAANLSRPRRKIS
jgi:hypothetical protein|tara:strand:+ start:626 stop:862 length:237 start_codon:yes stop_codon:yes gene_type:complete